MTTYKSKTGYIKCKADNAIYKNDIIYLGIYDSKKNYEDATEEEYETYQANLEKETTNQLTEEKDNGDN